MEIKLWSGKGKRKMYQSRKRVTAFALAVAMICMNLGSNVNVVFATEYVQDYVASVVCRLDGTDLWEAAQTAINDKNVFDFSELVLQSDSVSLEKSYEKIFGKNDIYEVFPDITYEGFSDGVQARVFVKADVKGDSYVLDGSETIIFLFENSSEEDVVFRANVGGYITEKITVKSHSAVFGEKETDLEMPLLPEETTGTGERIETTSPTEESTGDKAPETDTSDTSESETESSEIKAPDSEQPETDVPGSSTPESGVPETNAPENKVPETNAPETDAPETNAPETDAPDTGKEDAQAPAVDVPEVQEPEADAPEPEILISMSYNRLPMVATTFDDIVLETEGASKEQEKVTEAEIIDKNEAAVETTEAIKNTEALESKETLETTETLESAGETGEVEETESDEEIAGVPDETISDIIDGDIIDEDIDEGKIIGNVSGKVYGVIGIDETYTARAFVTTLKKLSIDESVEKSWRVSYTVTPVGSAAIKGEKFVEKGAELTFQVNPTKGYAIETVTSNGQEIEAEESGAGHYIVPEVTEDIEIEVAMAETGEHPAFNQSVDSNGVTITVSADQGILPEGTELKVKEVTQYLENTVKEKIEADSKAEEAPVEVTSVLAYDITLWNDGEELDNGWSEHGYVSVVFSGNKIEENSKDADEVEILYADLTSDEKLSADNALEATKENLKLENEGREAVKVGGEESVNKLEFEVDHFTVYMAVATKGQNNSNVVTFDPNGGSGSAVQISRNLDNSINFPDIETVEFTYEDHRFVGWSTNIKGDGPTYVPGQYELEANKYYAIWLDMNANDNVKAEYYIRKDGVVQKEPAGYQGAFYFPAAGKGIKGSINSSIAINNDTTGLIEANLGTAPTDEQIVAAAKAAGIDYNPKAQFINWYVIKTADKTWHVDGVIRDIQKFELTYDSNGGVVTSVPGSYEYKSGEDIELSFRKNKELPKRIGYTFLGWSEDKKAMVPTYTEDGNNVFKMAEQNVTLYAIWNANDGVSYSIAHYTEKFPTGWNLHQLNNSLKGKTDDVVTADSLNIPGYTFDEANTDNILTGTISADGSLALKLYYKANDSKIQFVVNEGSEVPELAGKTGQPVSTTQMPVTTRDGYIFGGWYANPSFGGSQVTALPGQFPAGTTIYYAKWDKKDAVIEVWFNNMTKPGVNWESENYETSDNSWIRDKRLNITDKNGTKLPYNNNQVQSFITKQLNEYMKQSSTADLKYSFYTINQEYVKDNGEKDWIRLYHSGSSTKFPSDETIKSGLVTRVHIYYEKAKTVTVNYFAEQENGNYNQITGSEYTLPLRFKGDKIPVKAGADYKSIISTNRSMPAGYNFVKAEVIETKNEAEVKTELKPNTSYEIGSSSGTVNVYYGKTLTLTVSSGSKARTYNGEALKDDTITYSGLRTGHKASGVKTNGASLTDVGKVDNLMSGTLLVTDGQGNDVTSQYKPELKEGILEVTKRPVTLTTNGNKKEYDGTALTMSGVEVTGEKFISGKGAAAKAAGSQTNVGTSQNTIELTWDEGAKKENYSITENLGTLEVEKNKTAITITAGSAGKVYDGTALTSTGFTYTPNVLASGDVLSVKTSGSVIEAGESVNNRVISYKVMRGDVDVTQYYTFEESAVGKLEVTKRPVTVTVASKTDIPYDGKTHSVGYTLSAAGTDKGLLDVHKENVLLKNNDQKYVGNYQVDADNVTIVSGNIDVTKNYEITLIPGTIHIKQAEGRIITVTAQSARKTYDGQPLISEICMVSGILFEGDKVRVNALGSATDVGDTANGNNLVGTVEVYNGTENVTENYMIETENGTLTIEPRTVSLTTQGGEKNYDGTALTKPGVEVGGAGFITGKGAKAAAIGSQTDVGTSSNVIELTWDQDGKEENYSITRNEGILEIASNKTPITITAGSGTKTYNGTALTSAEFTYTEQVLAIGDTLSVTTEGTVTDAGEPVENKVLEYRVMRGDKDVTEFYTFADTVSGTLQVDKRPVTLTTEGGSKVYDGTALTNSGVEISGEGFVGGKGAKAEASGSQTDVGTSENTVQLTWDKDAKAENYEITQNLGTLEVERNKTAIVITAGTDTKTYDGTALASTKFTYTDNVLANDDELLVTFDGSVTDVSAPIENKVVSYKVMRGDKDVTDNYTFAEPVSGTLEVTRRPVTITTQSGDKEYDGSPLTKETVTIGGKGFVTGKAPVITVTGSQTDVGFSGNTVNLVWSEDVKASNYDIKEELGTLTVSKKQNPITITASTDRKVYDKTALENAGYTYTEGVLEDGDKLVAEVSGSITDAGSTENIITSYKVMRGDKDVTENYTYEGTISGTLTVEPKEVTITVQSASKDYNTSDPEFTGKVVGILSDDNLQVQYVRTNSEEAAGIYENVITADYVENPNYAVSVTNGTFTIAASTDNAVNATGASIVYDGSAYGLESVSALREGSTILYSLDGVTYGGTMPMFTDAGTYTMYVKATNPNYSDTEVVKADIIIAKRSITITAGSADKKYNGTELTNQEAVVTSGSLAAEEVLSRITTTGSQLEAGSSKNIASEAVIQKAGNDTAHNYDITYADGTLTVTADSGSGDNGNGNGNGGNDNGNTGGGFVPNGPGAAGNTGDGDTVTINPEEVPLAALPQTDNLTGNSLIMIDDGLVPLAALPKTGNPSAVAGLVTAVSGIILAAYFALTRKKEK